MTIAMTPANCFSYLFIFSHDETDTNLPPTREMLFLMESGASNMVLKKSTFMLITQIISVYNPNQRDTSKTLTIAI